MSSCPGAPKGRTRRLGTSYNGEKKQQPKSVDCPSPMPRVVLPKAKNRGLSNSDTSKVSSDVVAHAAIVDISVPDLPRSPELNIVRHLLPRPKSFSTVESLLRETETRPERTSYRAVDIRSSKLGSKICSGSRIDLQHLMQQSKDESPSRLTVSFRSLDEEYSFKKPTCTHSTQLQALSIALNRKQSSIAEADCLQRLIDITQVPKLEEAGS